MIQAKYVRDGSVATISNFSGLVCPTDLTRHFAPKGQFRKLSNLDGTTSVALPPNPKEKPRRRVNDLPKTSTYVAANEEDR